MPDIVKCQNSDCPLKEQCYRWTSEPSEFLQAYNRFEPETVEKTIHGKKSVIVETKCEMFIPINKININK